MTFAKRCDYTETPTYLYKFYIQLLKHRKTGIRANWSVNKVVKIHLFDEIANHKSKCKFTDSCDFYSSESYTCTHTGGSYCGKFRKLDRGKQKKVVLVTQ